MEKPIEYWQEYYTRWSKTDIYKRNLQRAIDISSEFLEMDLNHNVSFSCGKDSTVLVHLVNSIKPGIKIVSEKDDMDFPEELPYLERLREKYNLNIDVITPPVSLWEEILKHSITEDIHSKGTDFSDEYFYGLLAKYHKENNVNASFLGLRQSESRGRAMNFRTKGHIYFNKSWGGFGQWICQPLALWSAKDIFAYLFSNDVPIMEVYFKTKFVKSPEDIRKAWILPSHQSNQGQALWLKYYYPQIFNKLAMIKPEMRKYV